MNHRAYVGLVAILAIFVLALTPTTTYAEAQPGTQMQEFQLQALDNKLYGTQGAEGKISILFFMGHNCDPCIGAAPAVEANIYQQVRTKPNVQMMGLDVWNGNVGELTLFRTITGVTFPL
ncbi:MAG: hypothetical protein QGG64_02700, partial [Candidatus Latescibacteria bacterium]|nr:hypothetical protein [Candidatus Latescibacterota bacterium]